MMKKEDIKEGMEFCIKFCDPETCFVEYRKKHGNPIVYRVAGLYNTTDGQEMVECEGGISFPLESFTDDRFLERNHFQLACYAKNCIMVSEEPVQGSSGAEAGPEGGPSAFSEVLKKMYATYVDKNHDYGNAFSDIYEELGINYAYGKIREKVNRIRTLKDKDANVNGEPLEDALLDCANYCVLTLVEYKKKKKG